MSDSTRYFQLTPDILVQYDYNYLDNVQEQEGDASNYLSDIDDNAYIVNNAYCSTRTLFWENKKEHKLPDEDKFVLPINKSESKFVQCVNKYGAIWDGGDDNIIRSDNAIITTEDNNDHDILCDNFILHFTSRNYLGNSDYDGFIITVHIYDKMKNKIGILSQHIRKDDDPNLNENPVIINQKLYTTKLEFKMPNINAILNGDTNWVEQSLNGSERMLRDALSPKHGIMDNTPIVMTIYGIKSTYTNRGFEYYTTEKLNSIYIPIIDKSSSLSIKIEEATDGDYFEIYPTLNSNRISFSDYIDNISDGNPDRYIVFYELELIEYDDEHTKGIRTHREQFIINAKNVDVDEINEDELDRHIYYRPVLRNSGNNLSFDIIVKTHIINTLDNTTILVEASENFDKSSAKKYGKRMNRIYLGEVPAKVNVYNKKPDIDIDGVKLTNASSSVKIENHQHSVIGFIECANVGVSIEQLPKELIS